MWISFVSLLLLFAIPVKANIPLQYREIFQTSVHKHALSSRVSETCLDDVMKVVEAARAHELWALNMIDSSTKIPSGIKWGHIEQFGNFDQCLRVRDTEKTFKGRYCRPVLNLLNETSLQETFFMRIGVCAPSTCTTEDIAEIVTIIAPIVLSPILGDDVTITATVDPVQCSQEGIETDPISNLAWGYGGLMVMLTLISVAATAIDLWGNTPPATKGLISIFSWRGATQRLFNTNKPKGDVSSLHGLRVLSMAWVVVGHHYSLYLGMPVSNLFIFMDEVIRRPLFMTIGNAYLAVDSFFFLGGFLICYVFMREMKKGHKFDIIRFYLYRFIRMTIPMAVVIGFYLAFITSLADGPIWESFAGKRLRIWCEKNWWAAMLYINNYINIFEQCLEQTWYTSADMQLAWMSPLILLPLHYSPRAGRQLLILVIIVSCLIPFGITYKKHYPWSVDMTHDYDGLAYTRDIYLPTHSRATPYVVGLFAAHFMDSYKKPLTKRIIAIGWALCTAVCLAVVYCLAIPYQKSYEENLIAASFYAGFHRLGWSLGLSWIVFACERGHGGPINAVLSWSWFLPLSRLCFAAYLTHLAIVIPYGAAIKTTTYVSHYNMIHGFLGDMPFVLFCSLLLYLIVESPLTEIMKRAFARKPPPKTVTQIAESFGKKEVKTIS